MPRLPRGGPYLLGDASVSHHERTGEEHRFRVSSEPFRVPGKVPLIERPDAKLAEAVVINR
jgi:hypothetical protein